MEKIEATYRIVTPMFIGDANKEATCIRPPSFKGALRFWWRALNWGDFRNSAGNDADALEALHAKEADLFGAAVKTENGEKFGGQGAFLLSVDSSSLHKLIKGKIHTKFRKVGAARYLGYGLMGAFGANAGRLERSCIDETSIDETSQTFTVKLVSRGKIDGGIITALKVLGLLGGLGSRSRHGMGSIALEMLQTGDREEWSQPTSIVEYDSQVKALFSSPHPAPALVASEPPFTAFWKDSRIDRLLSADSPYQILDDFGNKMLDYRSWGRTDLATGRRIRMPLPSGAPSEGRFTDDHHWFRKTGWSLAHPTFHPERVAFGLPHNYGQHDYHVTPEDHERRSSPLFFHVHQLDNNNFIGVGIYMPAIFLPDGEKINANGKKVENIVNEGKTGDVIVNFLDGKVGNPATRDDRFPTPDKKAVLP